MPRKQDCPWKNKIMEKSGKTHSPENGPVLVPPDGGGQGGGDGTDTGKVFVFVGLAVLLLLAAIVIWVLPDLGEKSATGPRVPPVLQEQRQSVASTPASAENTNTDSQAAEVAGLLGVWHTRQAVFEAENGALWGGDQYRLALEEAARCDNQSAQKNYDDALVACDKAISSIEELTASKEERLAEAISAGFVFLENGEADKAAYQFDIALAIDPAGNQAQKGVQQLAVRAEVLSLVQQGKAQEKDGDFHGAVKLFKQAVVLDPDFQPARLALTKTKEAIAEQSFQQSMGRALAALAESKFAAARTALKEARSIRPGDPVLVDLAGQIAGYELSANLSRLREKSITLESQEKWQQVVDICRQALTLSSTASFAVSCQDRAQRRLDLDKRLQSILAQPERLFDKDSLLMAKEIRRFAMGVSSPGPRLSGQIKELASLIDLAEAEVSVLLRSDTLTDIVIYHVGRLGHFAEKKLVLNTGNYTVVGSRQGFRDVRQTLRVRPGSELVFTVRCEEPI